MNKIRPFLHTVRIFLEEILWRWFFDDNSLMGKLKQQSRSSCFEFFIYPLCSVVSITVYKIVWSIRKDPPFNSWKPHLYINGGENWLAASISNWLIRFIRFPVSKIWPNKLRLIKDLNDTCLTKPNAWTILEFYIYFFPYKLKSSLLSCTMLNIST